MQSPETSSIMFVMNVSCHMCFDSSAAMQPHRPIGSPPKGATKWEPVVLRASLGFTGGYQNKHYSLVTETVSTDQGDQHFVTVKKNDTWLLHACRGSGYRRGDLRRSTIMDNYSQTESRRGAGIRSRGAQ